MIYKDGIRVNRIELIINETEQTIKCRTQLSDGKVWVGQPETIDPSLLYDKKKLENFTFLVLGKTLKTLNEEMEK